MQACMQNKSVNAAYLHAGTDVITWLIENPIKKWGDTMWQDALKRCGLPVDGGELFEIWLNSSEANGAGEPETATETADGVELTWIEAGLELRARISTDAETGVVRLSGGMTNVGSAPMTLTRANWRFTLAERQYSLYTQAGGWSRENRGG